MVLNFFNPCSVRSGVIPVLAARSRMPMTRCKINAMKQIDAWA